MLRAFFCVSIAVVATFTWTTRISQSGKHIPVDVKTKQPHSCLQSRMYYDQNRRIFQCNSCGKDIRFSEFETSISSKRIPLNTKTGAHTDVRLSLLTERQDGSGGGTNKKRLSNKDSATSKTIVTVYFLFQSIQNTQRLLVLLLMLLLEN